MHAGQNHESSYSNRQNPHRRKRVAAPPAQACHGGDQGEKRDPCEAQSFGTSLRHVSLRTMHVAATLVIRDRPMIRRIHLVP
jgi:hypothetical protein